MREYRGKTTSKELPIREFNNVWVEGDLIKNGLSNKYYIHPFGNGFRTENELAKLMAAHEVIPETVGQFTGLTDKNGKKIFEGDIVTGRFLHSSPINSVITFRNGAFGLLWDRAGAEMFDAFTSLCNIEYEVIGNIHDQDIGEI